MKKGIFRFALLCALLLTVTGCARSNGSEGVTGEGTIPAPGAGREALSRPYGQEESIPPENQPLNDDHLFISDSPLYRGVVTESGDSDGRSQIKLESPKGVDFGYPSILMEIDENTHASFPLEELAVGDHIEAYYADRNDGLPPLVIVANRLPAVGDSVYNGEIVRFNPDGEYSMLEVRSLDGSGSIVFNIGEDTQMYIDADKLQPGVRVNVYHRGMLTRSIPPQGYALEIRPYYETPAR